MKRLLRFLCIGLALVLVTAACGGSEITKNELVDELRRR